MNTDLSIIQSESDAIKELFNFDGDEAQIKEVFLRFITNSQNGPFFFHFSSQPILYEQT